MVARDFAWLWQRPSPQSLKHDGRHTTFTYGDSRFVGPGAWRLLQSPGLADRQCRNVLLRDCLPRRGNVRWPTPRVVSTGVQDRSAGVQYFDR